MSKKKSGKTEFVKWFGPVLDALRDLGGSARPREITQWIGVHLNIPDEILNERYEKSGVLKFQNQIAWARQYLVWEELLESSKHGVWTLTNKGWQTKLNEKQAHDIFLRWVKIFQDLRDQKAESSVEKEAEKVVNHKKRLSLKTHRLILSHRCLKYYRLFLQLDLSICVEDF